MKKNDRLDDVEELFHRLEQTMMAYNDLNAILSSRIMELERQFKELEMKIEWTVSVSKKSRKKKA